MLDGSRILAVTVAESAVTLCEAERAFIFRFDGELLQLAAAYNATPGLLHIRDKSAHAQ